MLHFGVPGNYTVQQGDYLSKIAKQFGFSDYRTIWDYPDNADLKQQRQNPNVIFPGDVLVIPDHEPRTEDRITDQQHLFKKNARALRLRLTLEDQYEKPVANAACILTLKGETRHLTTDADGKIDEVIPPDMHDAMLIIQDGQTPFHDSQIAVKIGDLNPETKLSGQAGRLNNLGYFAGELDQPDPESFKSAVEEFQCDQGMLVDGVCGADTQAKLKEVHGC